MRFTDQAPGLYLSQSPQSHRVLKKSADPVEQQGFTGQEGRFSFTSYLVTHVITVLIIVLGSWITQ